MTGSAVRAEWKHKDGWLMASWHGEMDMSNATALETEALNALENSDFGLVIDLGNVSYVDSAGIRSLLTLRRLLADRQQKMFLVLPANSVLRKAFDIGGVSAVVSMYHSIEEALQHA